MEIEEVRHYALSLPQATEEPHFAANSFRIRGKIFATVPPEGGLLHVFVDEQQREQAITTYPEFCEKLWWGKKVAGVRVLLPQADPAEVKDLLLVAWKRKAPKKLVTSLDCTEKD